MAAGARKGQKKSSKSSSNGSPTPKPELNGREVEREAAAADKLIHETALERFKDPPYPSNRKHEWTDVQLAAARLYGQGHPRPKIARALVDHLVPVGTKDREGFKQTPEKRLKNARSKLKRWEEEQWFRDKIFELAIIKTDLEVPGIMEGVVKKAKRGRVDAAKLALQMAGRMPEDEGAGGNVTVVFGSIPRPEGRGGSVTIEDADYEELE